MSKRQLLLSTVLGAMALVKGGCKTCKATTEEKRVLRFAAQTK